MAHDLAMIGTDEIRKNCHVMSAKMLKDLIGKIKELFVKKE
jgi:hypothetical protein